MSLKEFTIKDLIKDPFYIKMFFIVMPLLLEVSILIPILTPFLKLGLVWAAIFLLLDVFTERQIFKVKLTRILWVFVISYGITILLNRNTQFQMNFIGYTYIIVTFLVLLLPAKNDILDELYLFNDVIIKTTIIFSVIGVFLYLIQLTLQFQYLNSRYFIGVYANRLIGAYRGVTTPTTAIAIMISCIQLAIINYRKGKGYGLPVANIIVNFIHTGLSNSKGILLGLYVFIGVIIFFYLYRNKEFKNIGTRITVPLIFIALTLLVTKSVMKLSRQAVANVASEVTQLYIVEDEDGEFTMVDNEPIELDREIPGNYDIFTGRPYIWKQGLERFSEKPILGYGAYTHAKKIKLPFGEQRFSTYHNFYIHTLASAGIIGFASIMSYLLVLVLKVLTYLFNYKEQKRTDLILITIVAFLGFMAFTNMAETSILYMNKFSEFIFWIYLGSLVQIMNYENGDFYEQE